MRGLFCFYCYFFNLVKINCIQMTALNMMILSPISCLSKTQECRHKAKIWEFGERGIIFWLHSRRLWPLQKRSGWGLGVKKGNGRFFSSGCKLKSCQYKQGVAAIFHKSLKEATVSCGFAQCPLPSVLCMSLPKAHKQTSSLFKLDI